MLLMTVTTDYSPTMVRAKAEIYRSRAWRVALGVAAVGGMLYAGTFVNGATMVTATELFKKGFGLHQTSVRKLAKLTGKDEGELQRFVDDKLSVVSKVQQLLKGEINVKTLRQAFVAANAHLDIFMTALAVDAAVDVAVPFVGSLAIVPFSFGLAWRILCIVIDEYEQCALALHDFAFR
ncbi:uncharacterized protein LOC118414593 [Branchiostoma floridae]|uniref:Uncharacterized protein LOC118414593 n=1 Tax=Branchiostoma floridae TaxID=7739 RepID=A0A9J7MPV7_BRAFL|nr:uncharacterized protein LOC118414593 [Branchiostoma floridae]